MRKAQWVRPEALGLVRVETMGSHQGVQKFWVGAHQQIWVVLWGREQAQGFLSIEAPGKLH